MNKFDLFEKKYKYLICYKDRKNYEFLKKHDDPKNLMKNLKKIVLDKYDSEALEALDKFTISEKLRQDLIKVLQILCKSNFAKPQEKQMLEDLQKVGVTSPIEFRKFYTSTTYNAWKRFKTKKRRWKTGQIARINPYTTSYKIIEQLTPDFIKTSKWSPIGGDDSRFLCYVYEDDDIRFTKHSFVRFNCVLFFASMKIYKINEMRLIHVPYTKKEKEYAIEQGYPIY